MIYAYSNRRRAKDAILAYTEMVGDRLSVVVSTDGMVYIEVPDNIHKDILTGVFHFGEPASIDLGMIYQAEAYRGDATRKFRV